MQGEGECANTEVYAETNDLDIRMYNSMVAFEPDFTLKDWVLFGKIAHPDAVTPVGAFNMSDVGVYDRTNFVILDTDYSDWSIAWSCTDNEDNTSERKTD